MTTDIATEAAPGGVSYRAFLLIMAGLAGSWGWLLLIARYYWGMESYYNFGWIVPVMAIYFIHRNLDSRSMISGKNPDRFILASFACMLPVTLLLTTFVRLFSEANPFWRVPLWAHGVLLLGFSVTGLTLFGGKEAFKRFTFPLLFLLVALPWPYRIESWVIQSLTGAVSDITVFFLNFAGYPAVTSGNIIQIAEKRVAVEEACSGIRSLQTLVMTALFFGEVFRFGIWRRLFLLASAVFLSMSFNGFRAIQLALITINGDEESFHFWHDFLGNFNAIICSILVYIAAELLNALFGRSQQTDQPPICWNLSSSRQAVIIVVASIVGFAMTEGVVRTYYTLREASTPPLPVLAFEWPSNSAIDSEVREIPKGIQKALQFEFGEEVTLSWDDGLTGHLTHYGYTGEDRMASVSSFGHSPKVCMTAIGARLKEEKSPITVTLLDIPWQLKHYEFVFDHKSEERLAQVFWLVWENQQMGVEAEELGSLSWRNQWSLVKNGRRNFGRQVVIVYFIGQHPPDALRRKVQELLDMALAGNQPD